MCGYFCHLSLGIPLLQHLISKMCWGCSFIPRQSMRHDRPWPSTLMDFSSSTKKNAFRHGIISRCCLVFIMFYLLHSTYISVILIPGTSTHNSQQMLEIQRSNKMGNARSSHEKGCPTRSACAKHLGN